MERYLKLENIEMALGGQVNLPTAEELQTALSEAESGLFTDQGVISDGLLKAAWYLYSVASARKSLELYSADRQRRAYQVSAHIFDLALQVSGDNTKNDQLSLVFASQVGYIKGDLDPNAAAVYRRFGYADGEIGIEDENLPLLLGTMFLAMDRPRLFRTLPLLREKVASFESSTEGRLGVLCLLLDACWDLLRYVSYGDSEAYVSSLTSLENIVRSDVGLDDVDMRWVAAHLLDIAEDFGNSSVWSMLPPGVPPEAARAMTLGSPPVLNLWPPQAQLIRSDDANNPLLLTTKRLFLSIPTSAGKTLLAQYIAVAHLAQNGGGICFVAPTHSLCREIRKSLSDRLRLLRQEVAPEVPVGFLSFFDDDIEEGEVSSPVEVITPERLAFMLRYRPKETLDKFKLFIIDEAHLIAEESRGLAIESTLSLLQVLTRNSEHRIILMSSSLGDGGHVVDWMGVAGSSRTFHSEWRGPRRLYGLYSLERSNESPEIIEHAHRGVNERHFKYKNNGVIALKLADTPQIRKSLIAHNVGVTRTRPRVRGENEGTYKVYSEKSTPFYKTLVPLVNSVARSGPVLVIMPTRVLAQSLTREIAETKPLDDQMNELVDLAEARVGTEHLITKMLRKGVAFHHAALPVDLQVAIEQAVRTGRIRILVSTTTLADGVNLPVKTVIIGSTGAYGTGGFNDYISGAQLVNAIGRAGRAGRETEGWIILADSRYSQQNFDRLEMANPSASNLISQLTSEVALLSLANMEASIRDNEHEMFDSSDAFASEFASYIWIVANTLLEVKSIVSVEEIDSFLGSTLAWQQMDDDLRNRWKDIAHASFAVYEATPATKRKRWAQSGMRISSARKLEELSNDVLRKFLIASMEAEGGLDVSEGVTLLLTDDVLGALFSLPEAPKTDFRPFRSASPGNNLNVSHKQLVKDWINGVNLTQLVETHLSSIEDREYAYEILGDYITNVFQHYLPWTLGVIIDWVNTGSEGIVEDKPLINTQIASYVRYGVDNYYALRLMMNGVISRQLALRVSSIFMQEDTSDFSRWLQRMKISNFVDNFGVNETEARELLAYLRPKDSNVLADFISGDAVELDYRISSDSELTGEVTFAYLDGGTVMHRLGIKQDGMTCDMPLRLYLDVEEIIQSGLPYKATLFKRGEDLYGLRVKLQTFVEDQEVTTEDLNQLDF